MNPLRAILSAALLTLTAAAIPAMSNAALARAAPIYTADADHLALDGYDPVAYFTDAKPTPGSPTITAKHNGAVWRFATTAHREAFVANPTRYAPQYGGYCAWAVSQGYTASGDPQAWKVVGDKLYVNYNRDVAINWSKNIPGNIMKANANWPTVLDKE
jgi:hypothetical protein